MLKLDLPSAPKPINPKDSVGVRKAPASVVPQGVVAELGLAMLEGARKYGRHNYRVAGIVASVNYDAARGHIDAWWEGEDLDPDSQLSHVTKAIAALTVLRDGMMQGNWIDDRPPPTPEEFRPRSRAMNAKASAIIDKHPDAVPAFTARPQNVVQTFAAAVVRVEQDMRAAMQSITTATLDAAAAELIGSPEAVAPAPERAFKVGDRVRVFSSLSPWEGTIVEDDGADEVSGIPYRVERPGRPYAKHWKNAENLELIERATA